MVCPVSDRGNHLITKPARRVVDGKMIKPECRRQLEFELELKMLVPDIAAAAEWLGWLLRVSGRVHSPPHRLGDEAVRLTIKWNWIDLLLAGSPVKPLLSSGITVSGVRCSHCCCFG